MPVVDPGGHPQRASIVTRGSRWRRGVRISGALVAVAALAALSLWWIARDSGPVDVSREFLEATSVATLYELASEDGDELLDGGGANDMVRVAQGRRTYSDPRSQTLTRTLTFSEPQVEGTISRVTVTVSYASEKGAVHDDSIVVMLVREHDEWRVADWLLSSDSR